MSRDTQENVLLGLLLLAAVVLLLRVGSCMQDSKNRENAQWGESTRLEHERKMELIKRGVSPCKETRADY